MGKGLYYINDIIGLVEKNNSDTILVGHQQALVKIFLSGICGTDISIIEKGTKWLKDKFRAPVILGHEFIGEVIAVGDKNYKNFIGKKVVANSISSCGVCWDCNNGYYDSCSNSKQLGFNVDGCFSDKIVLDISQLKEVPDCGVNDELFVLSEPLGCAFKAVLSVKEEIKGKNILICGLGSIGYFIGCVARLFEANIIIGIDPINSRRLCATKAVIKNTKVFSLVGNPVNLALSGDKYDLVFEASGDLSITLNYVTKFLKSYGKIVAIGRENKKSSIDFNAYIDKQLSLIFVRGHVEKKCVDLAINFIENYPEIIANDFYKIFLMADYKIAFDAAINKSFNKVFIKP